MKKRLTILDIARLAGVSKSTVSRVLNQQARVDDETRKHVLHIIEEYDFMPSLNAKGLKGHSQLIGMLVPALTWPLILEVIQGIAAVVESSTYELLLYNFSLSKDFGDVIDRIVTTRLSAGLLALIHRQSPSHLLNLYQQGIPVVLINTTALRVDLPLVVTDNYGGASQAVQYLLGLGHRRIAYIDGPPDLPCSCERYRAYCDALNDAGITPDPTLYQQGLLEIISGRECAERLLALDELPTAIFAANDDMAYGVMDIAQARGLRIPEDLSIIGFDDNPPSASTHPALTTIRQPFREMGRCAVELLLSLLDPQYPFSADWKKFAVDYRPAPSDALTQQDEAPIQIQLPATLVERASCGVTPSVPARTALS